MKNLELERKYFIENGEKASYFQWLRSKGTNFTCYEMYMNSLNEEQYINNKISVIRTIIYAFNKPIQFTFFYWTLLILILHKFNFKKPIIKIVLVHFILRVSGDIVDKFGDLMPRYYANTPITDKDGNTIGYQCKYDSSSPEMHPLKWFLTRQIGCMLWCLGEMVADWYPLLRTRAAAKDQQYIWIVYITCGIFNFSKLLLIIIHWLLSPTKLYDEHGVYQKKKIDLFYFDYWIIQLSIIYASFIYDFSVYYVIKKSLSEVNNNQISFLKKFKSFSQYRILVSAWVGAVFLPIISFTIIIKFYFYLKYDYHNLEFTFDEIRQSINNLQYFMIFIDQVLLIRSNEEESEYTFDISYDNHLGKYNISYTLNNNNTLINSSNPSSSMDQSFCRSYNDQSMHRKCSNSNSLNTLYENSFDNQSIYRTNRSNSYSSNIYYNNLNNLNNRNNNNINSENQPMYRYNHSTGSSSGSIYNNEYQSSVINNHNNNLLNDNRNNIFNNSYYNNNINYNISNNNDNNNREHNYDKFNGIDWEWNFLSK
ncbi:hypothetical protein H8356DRAFT_1737034 [Neocallimastix lanati (nom. inval.)]|nr:hypothetical protein H8356DRAFT_1737034 [Neocallimastix sp. JGI-2020a]